MKKDLLNFSLQSLAFNSQLADRFAQKLSLPEYKTAGKKPMSRAHIQKAIEKAKKQHALLKKEYDVLEADDTKVKTRLEDTRNKLQFTRKQLINMHRGMQHMDIANADDAVFYDDDDEIGYVIKGKEYHMDINDAGDVSLKPMNKHRKELRSTQQPEQISEEDSLEAKEQKTEMAPDAEAAELSDDELMAYLHNSLSDEEI